MKKTIMAKTVLLLIFLASDIAVLGNITSGGNWHRCSHARDEDSQRRNPESYVYSFRGNEPGEVERHKLDNHGKDYGRRDQRQGLGILQ